MRKRLSTSFFNRPTLRVARELLGKTIVRRYRGRNISGIITETEAYIGPTDRAAHSFLLPEKSLQQWHPKFHELLVPHVRNPREAFEAWAKTGAKITKRNVAEYLEGGTIYIYLIYGMYWNANFSTSGYGLPECVLLRAVFPSRETKNGFALEQAKVKEANGPGKLCKYLKLDKSFYGENVCRSKRILIEERGVRIPARKIKIGPRIGIDYAGPKWAAKPWRFWVEPKDVIELNHAD